ncbi:cupredoxin domain-containing protein [Agrococcus lahaulensis]|uniref:cupredoxin domain-containing protein n=1 Tax=Agrococcus lahaulensis TaxID=341722 RepID=UPI00047E2906|nr:plastocyanin/azurin family copper-binding protein [Agrococcus lahaulensis]
MRHSRSTAVALACAVALALAGCASGSAEPESPDVGAPAASSAAPGLDPSPPATPSDVAAAGATPLTGVVGTDDDPEAYAIELRDASGTPVESLPAGTYALTFADRSSMHNFRLRGPGVDVATDVAGSDESTVEVTLEPGTYEIVCDPHSGTMRAEIQVG